MTAGGSLAHARTHTASDALLIRVRLTRRFDCRKIHMNSMFQGFKVSGFQGKKPTLAGVTLKPRHLETLRPFYPTISSKCGTFFTMPRMADVFGRSITWLSRVKPSPLTTLLYFRGVQIADRTSLI